MTRPVADARALVARSMTEAQLTHRKSFTLLRCLVRSKGTDATATSDSRSMAFASSSVGITSIVWMSSWAMGLRGLILSAKFAQGGRKFHAVATQTILSMSNKLNVFGIHARPIATEMVWLKAIWNWADERRVGIPMSLYKLVVDTQMTIATNLCPCPNPARCSVPQGAVLVNLSPETNLNRDTPWSKVYIAVTIPPHIVLIAPRCCGTPCGEFARHD